VVAAQKSCIVQHAFCMANKRACPRKSLGVAVIPPGGMRSTAAGRGALWTECACVAVPATDSSLQLSLDRISDVQLRTDVTCHACGSTTTLASRLGSASDVVILQPSGVVSVTVVQDAGGPLRYKLAVNGDYVTATVATAARPFGMLDLAAAMHQYRPGQQDDAAPAVAGDRGADKQGDFAGVVAVIGVTVGSDMDMVVVDFPTDDVPALPAATPCVRLDLMCALVRRAAACVRLLSLLVLGLGTHGASLVLVCCVPQVVCRKLHKRASSDVSASDQYRSACASVAAFLRGPPIPLSAPVSADSVVATATKKRSPSDATPSSAPAKKVKVDTDAGVAAAVKRAKRCVVVWASEVGDAAVKTLVRSIASE
jgi:hypothetical protein